jgi:hypothetical protein
MTVSLQRRIIAATCSSRGRQSPKNKANYERNAARKIAMVNETCLRGWQNSMKH